MKQHNLNWYLDVANTSSENRMKILELVRTAPEPGRQLFRLTEESGKTVWWWQRLSLPATKALPPFVILSEAKNLRWFPFDDRDPSLRSG